MMRLSRQVTTVHMARAQMYRARSQYLSLQISKVKVSFSPLYNLSVSQALTLSSSEEPDSETNEIEDDGSMLIVERVKTSGASPIDFK